MIDYNKSFETNNLLIRPMKIDDYNEMYKLTANPEMWKYFTADLSDKGVLKSWIKAAVNDSSRLALTIIDKEATKVVGSTSIGNISIRDKRAEIGWTWISEVYQGTGANAAVKILLLQYLFEESGCIRVELKTDVLNKPARKSLAKIGFVEEGVLRSHTQMVGGRRRDTIFYSLLSHEWPDVKNKVYALLGPFK